LESLELETEVHDALGRLPEGDRQLLVLRHFLDHSYEEIAEVLRIPAKTVKSRLFAARQRLRAEFERRGLKPCRTIVWSDSWKLCSRERRARRSGRSWIA
ncbi:MAG: RNA polymerase sigma factor, partial [Candidatus Eisenbacteria bacterium]